MSNRALGGDGEGNQEKGGEQGDWDASSSKSDGGVPSSNNGMLSMSGKGLSQSMLGQGASGMQASLQSLQPHSVLGMPSAMDDMTNGLDATMSSDLGNPSALGINGGMGAGVGGTDDFASMFGVSDIFDFDFDGGNDAAGSGSGLLGSAGTSGSNHAGTNMSAGHEDKAGSDASNKVHLKAEP